MKSAMKQAAESGDWITAYAMWWVCEQWVAAGVDGEGQGTGVYGDTAGVSVLPR